MNQTHQNIKILREMNQWSQEEMAEKLAMSPSGYAKIERGEVKLYLDKLEKIANVFNVDVADLLNSDKRNIYLLISENSHSSSNYYNSDSALVLENEKLKLSLAHQEKLIEQYCSEIALLKEMNLLLKSQIK